MVALLSSWVDFSSAQSVVLPTGARVVSGNASVAVSNNQMTVTQASQNAILNWSTFNVGASASVNFVQPNAQSVALNRVLASSPSQIDGSISSNGIVFLINPSGVVFGQGAQVNVGGMVASTLDISNTDFLAGRYNFSSNGSAGSVINRGAITAAEQGYVALLGNQVSNQGVISARLGSVALAAGNQMALSIDNSGLVSVGVSQGALNALVQNQGAVIADGGRVLLTAKSANDILANVVNNTGIIQAQGIGTRNGEIWMLASDPLANTGVTGQQTNAGHVQNAAGAVYVGGTLDVSNASGGGAGQITLAGSNVEVAGTLNASSTSGAAGKVLINSTQQTTLDASGVINVSSAGAAGSAILWSDQATAVHGLINGAGVGGSGSGATVEISSAGTIRVDGSVNVGAVDPHHAGSILLDPLTLDIGTDVTKTFLESQTGAINLTADGQITVDAGLNLHLQATGVLIASSLSGGITFAGSGSGVGSITTTGAPVTLAASGTGSLANIGQITTQGGNINLSGIAVNLAKGLDAGTGAVNVSVFGGGITGTTSAAPIRGAAVTLDATYGYIGTQSQAITVSSSNLNLITGGSLYVTDLAAISTLNLTANHLLGAGLVYSLTAPNLTLWAVDTQGGDAIFDAGGRYASSVRWTDYSLTVPSGYTGPTTVSLTQDTNLLPENIVLPGAALSITSTMGAILGGNYYQPIVADSLVLRSPNAIGGINHDGNINSLSLYGSNAGGVDNGWQLNTGVANTVDAQTLTPTGQVSNNSIVSLIQYGVLQGVAKATYIDLSASSDIGSPSTPFVVSFDGSPYNGNYSGNSHSGGSDRYVANHIVSNNGSIYLSASYNSGQTGLDIYNVQAPYGSVTANIHALNCSNCSDVYVDSVIAGGGAVTLNTYDTGYLKVNYASATTGIIIDNQGDTDGLNVQQAILYGADSSGRSININSDHGNVTVWKLSTNGDIWGNFGSYFGSAAPVSSISQGTIAITAPAGSIYNQQGNGYFVAGQVNLTSYGEINVNSVGIDTNAVITLTHLSDYGCEGCNYGDFLFHGFGLDPYNDPSANSFHPVHFASITNANGGVDLLNWNGDVLVGRVRSWRDYNGSGSSDSGNIYIASNHGGIYADPAVANSGLINASDYHGSGGYINLNADTGSLGMRGTSNPSNPLIGATYLRLSGNSFDLTTTGDLFLLNNQFDVNNVNLTLHYNNQNAYGGSYAYDFISGPMSAVTAGSGYMGQNWQLASLPSIAFTAASQYGSNLVGPSNGLLTIFGGQIFGNNPVPGAFSFLWGPNDPNQVSQGVSNFNLTTDGNVRIPAGQLAVLGLQQFNLSAGEAVVINSLLADYANIAIYAQNNLTINSSSSFLNLGQASINTSFDIESNQGSVRIDSLLTSNAQVYVYGKQGIQFETLSNQLVSSGSGNNAYGNPIIKLESDFGSIAGENTSNLISTQNLTLINDRGISTGSSSIPLNLAVRDVLDVSNFAYQRNMLNDSSLFDINGGSSVYLVTVNDPLTFNLRLSAANTHSSTIDSSQGYAQAQSTISIMPAQGRGSAFELFGQTSFVDAHTDANGFYHAAASSVTIDNLGYTGVLPGSPLSLNLFIASPQIKVNSGSDIYSSGVGSLTPLGYNLYLTGFNLFADSYGVGNSSSYTTANSNTLAVGNPSYAAGSFTVGGSYVITDLGTTTQAQWNAIAGTTGVTYVVGSTFTATNTGASSGTGAANSATGGNLVANGNYIISSLGTTTQAQWNAMAGTTGVTYAVGSVFTAANTGAIATGTGAVNSTQGGSLVAGHGYVITDLGTTTQAQWNAIAGTTGVTYAVGMTFTAANSGTGAGTGVVNPTLGGNLVAGNGYVITDLGTTTQAQWNTIAGTTGVTYAVGMTFIAANSGIGSGSGATKLTTNLSLTGSSGQLVNLEYQTSDYGWDRGVSNIGNVTGSISLTNFAITSDYFYGAWNSAPLNISLVETQPLSSFAVNWDGRYQNPLGANWNAQGYSQIGWMNSSAPQVIKLYDASNNLVFGSTLDHAGTAMVSTATGTDLALGLNLYDSGTLTVGSMNLQSSVTGSSLQAFSAGNFVSTGNVTGVAVNERSLGDTTIIGNFTANDVTLNSGGNLGVSGTLTASDNASLTASGALSVTGNIFATNQASLTSSGNMSLAASATPGTGNVTASVVTLNSQSGGAISVAGSLAGTTSVTTSSSGATTVAGSVTGGATTGGVFTGAPVTMTSLGNMTISGSVAGSTIALTTGSSQYQMANLVIPGNVSGTAVSLTSYGYQNLTGAIAGSTSVTLDAESATLMGSNAFQPVYVPGTGNAIVASSLSTPALTLKTSGGINAAVDTSVLSTLEVDLTHALQQYGNSWGNYYFAFGNSLNTPNTYSITSFASQGGAAIAQIVDNNATLTTSVNLTGTASLSRFAMATDFGLNINGNIGKGSSAGQDIAQVSLSSLGTVSNNSYGNSYFAYIGYGTTRGWWSGYSGSNSYLNVPLGISQSAGTIHANALTLVSNGYRGFIGSDTGSSSLSVADVSSLNANSVGSIYLNDAASLTNVNLTLSHNFNPFNGSDAQGWSTSWVPTYGIADTGGFAMNLVDVAHSQGIGGNNFYELIALSGSNIRNFNLTAKDDNLYIGAYQTQPTGVSSSIQLTSAATVSLSAPTGAIWYYGFTLPDSPGSSAYTNSNVLISAGTVNLSSYSGTGPFYSNGPMQLAATNLGLSTAQSGASGGGNYYLNNIGDVYLNNVNVGTAGSINIIATANNASASIFMNPGQLLTAGNITLQANFGNIGQVSGTPNVIHVNTQNLSLTGGGDMNISDAARLTTLNIVSYHDKPVTGSTGASGTNTIQIADNTAGNGGGMHLGIADSYNSSSGAYRYTITGANEPALNFSFQTDSDIVLGNINVNSLVINTAPTSSSLSNLPGGSIYQVYDASGATFVAANQVILSVGTGMAGIYTSNGYINIGNQGVGFPRLGASIGEAGNPIMLSTPSLTLYSGGNIYAADRQIINNLSLILGDIRNELNVLGTAPAFQITNSWMANGSLQLVPGGIMFGGAANGVTNEMDVSLMMQTQQGASNSFSLSTPSSIGIGNVAVQGTGGTVNLSTWNSILMPTAQWLSSPNVNLYLTGSSGSVGTSAHPLLIDAQSIYVENHVYNYPTSGVGDLYLGTVTAFTPFFGTPSSISLTYWNLYANSNLQINLPNFTLTSGGMSAFSGQGTDYVLQSISGANTNFSLTTYSTNMWVGNLNLGAGGVSLYGSNLYGYNPSGLSGAANIVTTGNASLGANSNIGTSLVPMTTNIAGNVSLSESAGNIYLSQISTTPLNITTLSNFWFPAQWVWNSSGQFTTSITAAGNVSLPGANVGNLNVNAVGNISSSGDIYADGAIALTAGGNVVLRNVDMIRANAQSLAITAGGSVNAQDIFWAQSVNISATGAGTAYTQNGVSGNYGVSVGTIGTFNPPNGPGVGPSTSGPISITSTADILLKGSLVSNSNVALTSGGNIYAVSYSGYGFNGYTQNGTNNWWWTNPNTFGKTPVISLTAGGNISFIDGSPLVLNGQSNVGVSLWFSGNTTTNVGFEPDSLSLTVNAGGNVNLASYAPVTVPLLTSGGVISLPVAGGGTASANTAGGNVSLQVWGDYSHPHAGITFETVGSTSGNVSLSTTSGSISGVDSGNTVYSPNGAITLYAGQLAYQNANGWSDGGTGRLNGIPDTTLETVASSIGGSGNSGISVNLNSPNIALTANNNIYANITSSTLNSLSVSRIYVDVPYSFSLYPSWNYPSAGPLTTPAQISAQMAVAMPGGTIQINDYQGASLLTIADTGAIVAGTMSSGGTAGSSTVNFTNLHYGGSSAPVNFTYNAYDPVVLGTVALTSDGSKAGALSLGVSNPFSVLISSAGSGFIVADSLNFNTNAENRYSVPVATVNNTYPYYTYTTVNDAQGGFGTAVSPIATAVNSISGNLVGPAATFFVTQNGNLTVNNLRADGGIGVALTSGNLTVENNLYSAANSITLSAAGTVNATGATVSTGGSGNPVSISAGGNLVLAGGHVSASGTVTLASGADITDNGVAGGTIGNGSNGLIHIQAAGNIHLEQSTVNATVANTSAGSFAVGNEYVITSLGNTTQAQWNAIAGTTGVTYDAGSLFTAATSGVTGSGAGTAKVFNLVLHAGNGLYAGSIDGTNALLTATSGVMDLTHGSISVDNLQAVAGSNTVVGASINVGNQISLISGGVLDLSSASSYINAYNLTATASGNVLLGDIVLGNQGAITSLNGSIQGNLLTGRPLAGYSGQYVLTALTGIGNIVPVVVSNTAVTAVTTSSTSGDISLIAGVPNAGDNAATISANAAHGAVNILNYAYNLTLGSVISGANGAGYLGNIVVTNQLPAETIIVNTVTAGGAGAMVAINAFAGHIEDGGAGSGITASRVALTALGGGSDIGGLGPVRVTAPTVLAVSGGNIYLDSLRPLNDGNGNRLPATLFPIVANTADNSNTVSITGVGDLLLGYLNAGASTGTLSISSSQGSLIRNPGGLLTSYGTALAAGQNAGSFDNPLQVATTYLTASANGNNGSNGDVYVNIAGSNAIYLVDSNFANGIYSVTARGDINIGDGNYVTNDWGNRSNGSTYVQANGSIRLTSTSGSIYDNIGWSYGSDSGYDTLVAPGVVLNAYLNIGDNWNTQAPVYVGAGQITATSQTGNINFYNNGNHFSGFNSAGITLNAPQGSVWGESWGADLVVTDSNAAQNSFQLRVYSGWSQYPAGSIYSASSGSALISANSVYLQADNNIGSITAPIQLDSAYLQVKAYGSQTNGDVYLNTQGSIILTGDNYVNGSLNLTAAGDINLGDPAFANSWNPSMPSSGTIYANTAINLTATRGSIKDYYSNFGYGNWYEYSSLYSSSVTLTASGDIGNGVLGPVHTSTGNLNVSAGGNAWISNTPYNGYWDYDTYSSVTASMVALGGSVQLDSHGADIYLSGTNSAGTGYTLNAYNASIYNDPTTITAPTVTLYADNNIGTSGSPIQIQATYLTANANGGDAWIAAVGDITLAGNNSASGTYGLIASNGSILQGSGAPITASAVNLAADHNIGTSNAPIQLNTTDLTANAYGLNATNGDVYLSTIGGVNVHNSNSAQGVFNLNSGGYIYLYGNIVAGNAINLTAASYIEDYHYSGGTNTLAAPVVNLTAVNGIGDDSTIYTQASAVTATATSGSIYISNNNNTSGTVAIILNSSGDVYFDNQGDIVVTGGNSAAGTYALTAHTGSVLQGNSGLITANTVNLTADNDIGSALAPIQLDATYLQAKAYGYQTNGDVYLSSQGSIILVGDNYASGSFNLAAAGDINLGDPALVNGSYPFMPSSGTIYANTAINLMTTSGSINDYYGNVGYGYWYGYSSLYSNSLTLVASGDIGNGILGPVHTSTGNLNVSAGGNAWISNTRYNGHWDYNTYTSVNVSMVAGGSAQLDSHGADIYLSGSNSAGTGYTLNAYNASIYNDPTTITAPTVTLYADNNIGTSGSPIQIQATYLTANANGGDAWIAAVGDITLAGNNSASGIYGLVASNGSILQGNGALITASAVNLAADHNIGSSSAPIQVTGTNLNTYLTASANGLNGANGDVYLAYTGSGWENLVGNSNVAGSFNLTAPNGSISLGFNSGNDGNVTAGTSINLNSGNYIEGYGGYGTLTAPVVNLMAVNDIGWDSGGVNTQASTVTASTTGAYGRIIIANNGNAAGPVNVTLNSATDDVYFTNQGNVVMTGSNSAAGNYSLTANSGSILQGSSGLITANAVNLYADNSIGTSSSPIQIQATYLTANANGGDAWMTTAGDITLAGNNSASGTFGLVASNGTILQGSGALITANAVNLAADHDIGASSAPIQLSTTYLTANAAGLNSTNGDVYLSSQGNMTVAGSNSAVGVYSLTANSGSVNAAAGSWITASAVNLTADYNIGTVTHPVWFTASGLTTNAAGLGSGSDGDGNVYLGSNGNVVITGTLSAKGTYGLTALNGSIQEGSGGLINADGAYLQADNNIGAAGSPIQLHVNSLQAIAKGFNGTAGDAYLTDNRSVILTGSSSASGTFNLGTSSGGSILGATGSLVSAHEVELSSDGNVGASNAPVQLNTPYLLVNANGNGSNGDVYLSNQGAVTLVGNNTAVGTFSLMAGGAINLGDHAGTYQGGDIYAGSISLNATSGAINDYYSHSANATALVAPSISLTASGDVGNSTAGAIETATASLEVSAGGNVLIGNNQLSNTSSYRPGAVVVTLAGGGSVRLDSAQSDIELLNANHGGSTFTLHAPDGSILNDPTIIVAPTVNLTAGYGIGTGSSPVQIQATNLTAQANGGNVYVVAIGDITLQGNNSATGLYSLNASNGSILQGTSALVTAPLIVLAADHDLGVSSAPILLNATNLTANANGLNGTSGNAYLSNQGAITVVGNNSVQGLFSLVAGGNITLGQGTNSAGGDIYATMAISLNAAGSIIDNYAIANVASTLVSPAITLSATSNIGSAASSLGGNGPVYVATNHLNGMAGGSIYLGNYGYPDTNGFVPGAVTVTLAAGGCTTTVPCSATTGSVVLDSWSGVVINKIAAPVSVEVLAESGNISSAFASTLANPNILTSATPTLVALQAHPTMAGAADITAVNGTVGSRAQSIWVADISSSVAKDDYNYSSYVSTTTGGVTTGHYALYGNGLSVDGSVAWINAAPYSGPYYSMPQVPGVAPITTFSTVVVNQKSPSIIVALPIVPVGTPVQQAAPMATVVQQFGMTLPDNVAPQADTQNSSYGGTSEPLLGGNPTEIGRKQNQSAGQNVSWAN